MAFIQTDFEGLMVFEPTVWGDDRGYFYESFNEHTFAEVGIFQSFVQDNQAFSGYGVLRGLHYQVGGSAQSKLVRVIQGEVQDVVVDLRKDSATYGKSFSIRLSGENHRQLYVPRGFAHGYLVISETALFQYKCDNFYDKSAEGGLMYNDPRLGIEWLVQPEQILLSEKDAVLPLFGKHRDPNG